MKENDDVFETRDLVLATYLKYNKIDLVDGYCPESKTWAFSSSDECSKLALNLKNGKALVEPLSYESCRKNLLGMVYDRRGNGK